MEFTLIIYQGMINMEKIKGFTLIELLLTISIISILSSLAFASFISQHQDHTAISELLLAVNLSRNQSISSASITTLCPSENNLKCAGKWEKDLTLFIDHNGNRKVDPNDKIIRKFSPMPNGSKLFWRSFQNKQYLQFAPSGYTRNQNGTFTYCSPSKKLVQAKMLIVNRAGRPRVAQDTDNDGIPNSPSGAIPNCT